MTPREFPEDLRRLCVTVPLRCDRALSGVYFAVRGGQVVYVGQSKNVPSRCADARRRLTGEVEFFCYEMPGSDKQRRAEMEGSFIAVFGQPTSSVVNEVEGEREFFIRMPQWLHDAVAKEADARGESLSTVAREVLTARFADRAVAK